MNKKVIGIIIAVIIVIVIGGVGTFLLMGKENDNKDNSTYMNNQTGSNTETDNNVTEENDKNEDENLTNNNTSNNTKKVLVVYFSATSNTKSVAEKIAKNLDGDIFEIEPLDEYTREDLNYGNPNSRVSKEHDDESLRNVKLKTTSVANWDNYDTIIIGYPIWWGIAAWPVNTFVEANNFNGKTIIPFCTSVSSGLGQSGKLLEDIANGGNWLEGHRFNSRPSDSDIKSFTDSIK